MELNTIKDVFDRVVKKQKLSSSKSHEVIDQVGQEIEQALAKFLSTHDSASSIDQKSILAELKLKLNTIAPLHQFEGSQKELNLNLSRFLKLLEKFFNPDLSKAYRNVDFDYHTVNQIIANHFYQQGLFDLGDSIIHEAGEPDATAIKSQFFEMYQILEAMKVRNLEPALNWVYSNREKLKQNGSHLELKLHSLQYMEILQNGAPADALNYAKTYLAPFAFLYKEEIMKLMGCLAFEEGFPALLILRLPTLLKLANVMAAKKQEWQAMKQLPVPVELSEEFTFHSIFVCPVSREQGSEENPPMMMPCLHVLCKQSIMKLSKSSTRTFKCPYCPAEASVAHCRQLYF
ncbi:hypothetical protein FNV43_RR22946 [Rhamnella rubrinervis]|uniref:Uncharacterized protein n=1 Tax=Rhamnella rubrinervis TaxID=2594499 RepID=A0A8K0DX46_9ROSA|nr:hypothetical protein FNV43_RR22946 [Rhamnella rubrinervis]